MRSRVRPLIDGNLPLIGVAHPAYLAGLIDGEGTIGIAYHWSRGRPYFSGRIAIQMTATELIESIGHAWDGAIYNEGRRIERLGRKPCLRVIWDSKVALLRLLNAIEPYLVLKAPQAAILRELISLKSPHPMTPADWERREALRLRMLLSNNSGRRHLNLVPPVPISVPCAQCGTMMDVYPQEQRTKARRRFCGRSCYVKFGWKKRRRTLDLAG